MSPTLSIIHCYVSSFLILRQILIERNKNKIMMNLLNVLMVALVLFSTSSAYQLSCVKKNWRTTKLGMIELQADTTTYIGMFIATMVPSLALGLTF